jgi:hypothetical protein
VPGTTRARATVRDEDGALRLEGEPTDGRLAWPEGSPGLAPGSRAVVRVAVETPSGTSEGSAAFRVLSEAERRGYEATLERLRVTAPGGEAPRGGRGSHVSLVAAHAAARLTLWDEALRWLADADAAGDRPGDVAALRGRVEHQLGLSPR